MNTLIPKTIIPKTPQDCVADVPLPKLHHDLIIARIEYLLAERIRDAVINAIEQAHTSAMRALTAPLGKDLT